jgi:hypothetical protein
MLHVSGEYHQVASSFLYNLLATYYVLTVFSYPNSYWTLQYIQYREQESHFINVFT